MKKNQLFIAALILALCASACQNNSSKTGHSSMDTAGGSHMDTAASSGGMMAGMDKMMNEMHQMEMTGNATHDFAQMMHHHHMGAVEMAKTQLASGTDEELKTMARKIADMQGTEMQQLESIASKHKNEAKDYDPGNKTQGAGKAMDDNMMQMMQGMDKGSHSSVDHEFAAMMIKHHKDGIMMANSIIQYTKDADLKTMARKMIKDQSEEVDQFEAWLTTHKM